MSFAEHNTYAWHKANYQRRNAINFLGLMVYMFQGLKCLTHIILHNNHYLQ